MANRTEVFVALLRGINVGGAKKLPMARLRSLCAGIGCEEVNTYIQSGNVVVTWSDEAAALERRLEAAIEQEFGFSVPVLARSADNWKRYVDGNPFPRECETEANWVLLCLSKKAPGQRAAADLRLRATQGERVVKRGDAIWVHYAQGIAKSKLSPTVLDRLISSPVTTRNWRTVLKLHQMVRDAGTRQQKSAPDIGS